MVVVDSSALIPLARVGRLDLVREAFETVATVEAVREEVVVEGKRGAGALDGFLDDAILEESPAEAERIADLEGVAVTDAAVVLLADARGEPLLANDRGLIEVARSHGVDCWWVTTVLLHCTADGYLTPDAATDVLYDLVDQGMNLDPALYSRIQRELENLG